MISSDNLASHGGEMARSLCREGAVTQPEPRTTPARESPPGVDLKIGPLLVDLQRGEVFLLGQTIPLTRVEFDLLRHMMAHAHRIVTVEELVSFVIRGVHRPESSLVRVHMCHLRRKLGGAAAAITTIRGRGLRFDEVHLDATATHASTAPPLASTPRSKLLRSDVSGIELASRK